MEPDLLPYRATLPNARCVLVLAPHPDDEVFGCGGTLVRMREAGSRVVEIILTSGDQAGDADVREAESCAASDVLGLNLPQFWRLPDRGVTVGPTLVEKLVDMLEMHDVDLVLAPSPWEVHPDHRSACQLAVQAVEQTCHLVHLGFYEVGVPLRPNHLCDITSQVDVKRRAMDCFASQMRLQDYGEQVLALNRFRSYTLGAGVTHAEAFWLPAPSQWRDMSARLKMDWVSSGHVCGGAWLSDTDATGDLVTVIVVSAQSGDVEGGVLAFERLLDSISLQTYRRIQVLVLGATPCKVSGWLGCSVRWIQPGEIALITSGFVLFAQPGDWMLPGHVSRLVDTLDRLPHAWAARSEVGCRAESVVAAIQCAESVPCVSVLWRVAEGCATPERCIEQKTSQTFAFDSKWLHSLGPIAVLDGKSAWPDRISMQLQEPAATLSSRMWCALKRFWRLN